MEKVVKLIHPYLIILFGSFAKGSIHEGSDVDVLVVADFKEKFLDRISLLMKLNDLGLPLEPVGYTLDEFDDMLKRGNRFLSDLLKSSKVLYKGRKIPGSLEALLREKCPVESLGQEV